MATAALRLAPRRFRRSPARESVEILTARIDVLTAERQTLRTRGASAAALERNRIKIARAQWQLAHALIERHRPNDADRTAA